MFSNYSILKLSCYFCALGHSVSTITLQQKASALNSAPTLSCTTTGVPPTEVTWQKDGLNMTVHDNTTEMVKSITSRRSSTYSTSLLLYSDIDTVRGNYTCTAGNRLGTRTSQTLVIEGNSGKFLYDFVLSLSLSLSLS